MNVKVKQQGFTLIELVVVIVILGILAVTAAPKFIDLQGDAKAATIEGVKAAMESSTAMVHSKSLINGSDKNAGIVALTMNVGDVNVVNGWPTNDDTKTWDLLLDINAAEFAVLPDGTEGSGSAETYIYPTASTVLTKAEIVATECYVLYIESGSTNTKPAISTVTTEC